MSRASSQQRFYEESNDYQRQPDSSLINTRIAESYVEPSSRKPSVTFKNDDYEQQSQDLQQVAEKRGSIYQQQPSYEEQPYYQPQQPEYDYNQQQNMGYSYDRQQYVPPPQQQYEQPIEQARYYQSESRRQSPENNYQQGYTGSRRQSPEQQEYRYVEPQTPKRTSPPKTPTRELSREEIDKIVQQRQQSREQVNLRN